MAALEKAEGRAGAGDLPVAWAHLCTPPPGSPGAADPVADFLQAAGVRPRPEVPVSLTFRPMPPCAKDADNDIVV